MVRGFSWICSKTLEIVIGYQELLSQIILRLFVQHSKCAVAIPFLVATLPQLIANGIHCSIVISIIALHGKIDLIPQHVQFIIPDVCDACWDTRSISDCHDLLQANWFHRQIFSVAVICPGRENVHKTLYGHGKSVWDDIGGENSIAMSSGPWEFISTAACVYADIVVWQAMRRKLNSSLEASCEYVFNLNTVLSAFIKTIPVFVEIINTGFEWQGTTSHSVG